ncbi:TPA: Holliday junction branch migration protein RuvA [Patescibacteria group bacterium]|nr:Holliday junction branch migration protein RuvA [Patescibacteria group bacterium]
MIARVSGNIIHKGIDHLVVEAGGLGYKIFVVSDVIAKTILDQPVKLFTQLIVREDSQSLYGFMTLSELELFNLLISVSGVGPKIGLAVLSAGKIEELRSAIGCGDSAIFMAVSGIGKKTAERIILELKSKVGEIGVSEMQGSSQEIITALAGLGYNMYEIRTVIRKISAEAPLEEKVKEALKLLG